MLNEVLIAQAVLSALHALTMMFAVGSVLLILGILGRILQRTKESVRSNKPLRFASSVCLFFGALIWICAAGLVAYSFIPTAVKTYDWNLDFTQPVPFSRFEHEKCTNWVIGETAHRDCIFEGKINFKATFSNSRVVERDGYVLWITGENEDLAQVKLIGNPLSKEELLAVLPGFIKDWNLDLEAFTKWQSALEAGEQTLTRYFAPNEKDREFPWLEVGVRHFDEDSNHAKPWLLTLTWHFLP